MSVPSLGNLLVVGAHPDDETFTAAGLMAAAVREGRRVVCVTATRGEGGSMDPEKWPPASMAEVRSREMRECMDVLGVEEHHFLGYVDGTCHEVDHEEGTERILTFMREIQPDSVLTFGPDGMTGHPDHKAISSWTTTAFAREAKEGARLFYATQTPGWVERFVPVMNRFNVFGPGTPPVVPVEDLAIHLTLEGDLLDQKVRAIYKQISQVEHMIEAFGEEFFTEGMAEESFVEAPSP